MELTKEQAVAEFSEATTGAFGTKGAVAPVAAKEPATDVVPVPEKDAVPATPAPDAVPASAEITDEQFEAYLAKKTNGRVTKLADLDEPIAQPTPEQIAEQVKKKKSDGLAWAIGSQRINQEDYERAVVIGSKAEREIALELFAANVREIDPKITEDEIGQRFQDYYREELDDNDPMRVLAQKDMSKNVAAYRNDITGKVTNVEKDYDEYLTSTRTIKAFNKQVNTAFKEDLPASIELEYTFPHADGTEHTVKIPFAIDEKVSKSVRDSFQGNRTLFDEIKGKDGKVTNKDIVEAALYSIKANAFDAIPAMLRDAATAAKIATEAYYKGIPERRASLPIEGVNPSGAGQKQRAQEFSAKTDGAFNQSYGRN